MTKPEPAMVLMKDSLTEPSEAIVVSTELETLMDCAIVEDLAADVGPLRIGCSVEILGGDELRIAETKLQ